VQEKTKRAEISRETERKSHKKTRKTKILRRLRRLYEKATDFISLGHASREVTNLSAWLSARSAELSVSKLKNWSVRMLHIKKLKSEKKCRK